MSYEIPGGLPSLACPLIASPAMPRGKDEKPLLQPPFPEIDMNWEGFTLSHLHLMAIKATNPILRKRLIQLALLHEACHKELALRPYSLYIKEIMSNLYLLIVETFRAITEGKEEQLKVPVSANQPENKLKELVEVLEYMKERSRLVEEVYAVRSSLLQASKLDSLAIDDEMMQKLTTDYKEGYGEFIPEFPIVYEIIDLIAKKLGETVATTMIYNVLETWYPNRALTDIIDGLRGIFHHDFIWDKLSANPAEIRDSIANFSIGSLNDFFNRYTELVDHDGTIYRRAEMSKIHKEFKQNWREVSHNSEYDFYKLLSDPSPATFLFLQYTPTTFTLYTYTELEGYKEVKDSNFVIFLEAMRQQLTTGIGLLCPFWDSTRGCCGGDNKVLLEIIWSFTSPAPSCEIWERMGCLKQSKPLCIKAFQEQLAEILRDH